VIYKEKKLMSVIALIKKWRAAMLLALLLGFGAQPALAQFSSGSTGADGAFSPSSSQTIQVPASGVFNYTTVTIPAGVTITYTRNATNTPVTILATGDVVINGAINIDGQASTSANGALGGPGGFNGGKGGYPADAASGTSGEGPGGGCGGLGGTGSTSGGGGGGGYATAGVDGGGTSPAGGQGGAKYGSPLLLPLIGGSGGGGAGGYSTNWGRGGGGGGGAILIASSTAIRFGSPTGSGTIYARGNSSGGQGATWGGCSSGGAIRLVANTLTGNPFLYVTGGCTVGTNVGSAGYIRLEAYDFTGLTGSLNPLTSTSRGLPNPLTLTNPPQLKIKTVAGINSPASPKGSFQAAPDITVAATQSNPVTVELEGVRVPTGTLVQVTVIPEAGLRTSVESSALAGTFDLSTGTAQVTLPTGMSVLTASATVELLASADTPPMFIEGERVAQIEVNASYGGESEVTYITKSGRRVPASSLR
jgi:hypothetical protein